MSEIHCPKCGRAVAAETGAAFCPFCGGPISHTEAKPDSSEVQALLARAADTDDPVKKHKLLIQAQEAAPDSLAVAEELLFLGRLYQRDSHTLDFSVIKCYLLNPYLEPDSVSSDKRGAMRRELFGGPELERCLALSDDPAAFMIRYLTRLSTQYIDLFLHGSSRYMRRFFGFSLDSRAPKLLAIPAARMLAAMRDDAALTAEQRSTLMHAFFAAFSDRLNGDTQWLKQEMATLNVMLD